MNAITTPTAAPPVNILHRLGEWGYSLESAGDDLKAMAEQSLRFETLRAGDVVIELGYATRDKVESVLADKPRNVPTLEHLTSQIDNLRPHIQKILALTQGLPYYMVLPDAPHSALQQPHILKACNEYEAALITTPLGFACLVFTEFSRLKDYRQMGRDERANDPIYQLLEKSPLLAVGNRTEIYRLMSNDRGAVNALQQDAQTKYFTPDQATTESQKLVVRILDFAAGKKSSNIQLAPQPDGIVQVRYRQSGKMRDIPVCPRISPEQAQEINQFLHRISNATYTAGKKLVEGRLIAPADGQFVYKSQDHEVNLRLSFTSPNAAGLSHPSELVSIRLLPRDTSRVDLKKQKIKPATINLMTTALSQSQGLILLAGPTGSGKSTTIAGMLSLHYDMYGDTMNRLSAEDPIERLIPGIIQHQIDARNTFDVLMAAHLRQDPDLIFVGELRDRASAATCARAAGTGHVVVSTVHANNTILAYRAVMAYIANTHVDNANAAIVTENDLIESLNQIISQRLLPHLCPKCSAPINSQKFDNVAGLAKDYCRQHGHTSLTDAQIAQLRKSKAASPDGCSYCDHTGFVGELPINETLTFTRELKDLLHDMAERKSFKPSALAGFRDQTLFEAALQRVLIGEVALQDALI
ncbi:GspE/PulE family protein [Chromobacterium piscinae]|uniref:GspE/PulE family protein n=1 Tax=Chromobacterium piscinae TaxID=686831 RepID=UPI001E2AC091|nr:ATPase, T2SS/T4P/T4SS family [Chromobacterium piscinae]MCD5327914.1 Flp pilus assembly complex ATPase component TadA [Chromobacterium piscinae]